MVDASDNSNGQSNLVKDFKADLFKVSNMRQRHAI